MENILLRKSKKVMATTLENKDQIKLVLKAYQGLVVAILILLLLK